MPNLNSLSCVCSTNRSSVFTVKTFPLVVRIIFCISPEFPEPISDYRHFFGDRLILVPNHLCTAMIGR